MYPFKRGVVYSTPFTPPYCLQACEHPHCRDHRRIVGAACAVCGLPIGVNTRYEERPDIGLAHVHCTLGDLEGQLRFNFEFPSRMEGR